MAPTLYMTEVSPSCRAVLLTARMLGITLKLKQLNLRKNEHLSDEFLKINPQHTVPTLIDNGFVIWDSHAIIAFLVGKYGNDDDLYSRDILQRALIDQRLHFDSAVVSTFTRMILNPLYENYTIDLNDKRHAISEIYRMMEHFLRCLPWIAGKKVTIADLSLIPSITSLDVVFPIDQETYPNLTSWIKRSEDLPCYMENENGLNKLRCVLKCSARC